MVRIRTGEPADRGSSSLELAGMLPLLLLVALVSIQLGIAGYAIQQAGTAARAAARIAGQEEYADDYAGTGRAALSPWLASRARFSLTSGADEAQVTARVTIPSVVPGIASFGTASRTATMPRD